MGCLCRTKKGLGISSRSGSQVGTSFSRCAIRSANFFPLGDPSSVRLPLLSTGRPPALAWASSTSVRPFGATLAFMAMLFLMASLLRSAGSELLGGFFRVKLGFRVGDALASTPMFADDGILESRRLGDLLFSFNAPLLMAARRSG